ncbi:hypothetical protein XELAEV_18008681mg [Xenopus laevis]|uniref:G-protein coupled receptors family 3 profile domain-containing protein n=1 Tax=Xenopus laevis TaxID=8355 RepID=A0A974DQW9_XENLA|nr:hypothetical protein XELAEV_18008681mg [Xenopus laevis]
MDFLYVVQQIDNSTTHLPHQTLGYHIGDSCGDTRKAVKSVFKILSGTRVPVPNYSCLKDRNLAGFIGDLTSKTTVPIAQILSVYGYSQISYGATEPSLSDRISFPYFFGTVQSEQRNFITVVQFIKYFGWTWVGFITSDDINGIYEHQIFTQYLSSKGICLEFIIYMSQPFENVDQIAHVSRYIKTIEKSSSSVIIVGGTVSFSFAVILFNLRKSLAMKNLIFLPQWETYLLRNFESFEKFNRTLLFVSLYPYNVNISEISQYYGKLLLPYMKEDKLPEDIWMQIFSCLSTDHTKDDDYEASHAILQHKCTDVEYFLENMTFKHFRSYPLMLFPASILTCAIVDINAAIRKESSKTHITPIKYRHQFDEYGNLDMDYGIINSITHILPDGWKMTLRPVGKVKAWVPSNQQLEIKEDLIWWNTFHSNVPRSQCSDNCLPGFRKATKPGVHSCCYDCVSCSEGEISNITDSEKCFQCPDLEWPTENKTQCIAKAEEFLSYTNDVISLIVATLSILFFLITLLILRVYISYRDTPIVRANNRSLSFLLLVSIKLSFLSVFLFLGRPVDITCMLRNITFGITFSIAVSSLLAKTIMVCVAFKATKPGSSWRKWVGVKLSNSVVLFCSSIQIIICMTWLAISPPFQELDLHTYPGTIIIQCNEGSAIGFYSVIGYMGLLAAVSFVLAFLARTLPDSFNEAKYITFSMLLFCSVWITMIPAYLSTKGKNTVCVEIFAILTSSAGLLASIFLPKCYIILFRSEINVKSHLFSNKLR